MAKLIKGHQGQGNGAGQLGRRLLRAWGKQSDPHSHVTCLCCFFVCVFWCVFYDCICLFVYIHLFSPVGFELEYITPFNFVLLLAGGRDVFGNGAMFGFPRSAGVQLPLPEGLPNPSIGKKHTSTDSVGRCLKSLARSDTVDGPNPAKRNPGMIRFPQRKYRNRAYGFNHGFMARCEKQDVVHPQSCYLSQRPLSDVSNSQGGSRISSGLNSTC